MGAYIYRPGTHERQLLDWGFDRIDWANAFITWIAGNPGRYRHEIFGWSPIHQETFGAEPVLPDDSETIFEVPNDQPQLLLDSPTTDDVLGRKYFAETLACRID